MTNFSLDIFKLNAMRYAGKVNQQAIEHGFRIAVPGISLEKINKTVEDYILAAGCEPAFKNYQPEGASLPFPAAACISPNDIAVHGVPGDYILKDGDLLTIDLGTKYNGFFVDSARSRIIGSYNNEEAKRLIEGTEAILEAQLCVIRDGCSLLEIAMASEIKAKELKINIMPQWGGHGIGENIHAEPFIPSTIDRTKSKMNQQIQIQRYAKEFLKAGQTICIEPVTTFGCVDIIIDADQWTVRQSEGKLACHTERCLLILNEGYEILS